MPICECCKREGKPKAEYVKPAAAFPTYVGPNNVVLVTRGVCNNCEAKRKQKHRLSAETSPPSTQIRPKALTPRTS